MDGLRGSVAIVTGGGSGIGSAACLRLAREGCSVSVVGRHFDSVERTASACRRESVRALALEADVSERKAVRDAVSRTVDLFGRIDILVGNAGVVGPLSDVEDLDVGDWDLVFATNVRGMFLSVQACLPWMRQQGKGAIVLTGSNFGLVSTPHSVLYTTSKGAVAALSRALAVELVPDGIRVNCVCPGNVDTPMLDQALLVGGKDLDLAKRKLGRIATSDEIASAIAFLASDESSYITGAHLVVDFGETSRPGPVWPSPSW
jgi:NAD(P)-dependent dehydrogenase (short-subunit alcohol dehydrogenase family)